MNSWLFHLWKEYFAMTADNSLTKLEKDGRYILLEFPHGIFPMGQVVSVCMIKDLFPNHMMCGIGADVIFKFPFMRQFMSWIGKIIN